MTLGDIIALSIYCVRQANLIAQHKYSLGMLIILSLVDHTNTVNLSLKPAILRWFGDFH